MKTGANGSISKMCNTFQRYLIHTLEEWEYDVEDWELKDEEITGKECSDYFLKLVNERREMNGLKSL